MPSESYNNVRVNEGCAIGTIIAFAGGVGSVPKGWLPCDGRLYNGSDGSNGQVRGYDQLYAVIGNRYGGDAPNFKVPKLQGATADLKAGYANQPGGGAPGKYEQYLGYESGTPNTNVNEDFRAVNTESTFDLRVEILPVEETRFSCIVEDITLNEPSFSGNISFVPRMLGDHHFGTHSHGGTYPSIKRDPQLFGLRIDGVPDEGVTFSQTEDVKNYPCESNGNYGYGPNNSGCSYVVVTGVNANNSGSNSNVVGSVSSININNSNDQVNFGNNVHWGTSNKSTPGGEYGKNIFAQGHVQGADVGETWNLPSSNSFPDTPDFSFPARNLIDPFNSNCRDRVLTRSGYTTPDEDTSENPSGKFGYPVCLNNNNDTWSGFAHDHPTVTYDINIGSIKAPSTIFINNVTIGDVKPVNSAFTEVANIVFDSTEGVSANLLYIIRAY